MRLIDADALIEDCNILDAWDAQIVKAWLDDQPTAYDVDKVVTELYDSQICPSVAIGILNLEGFVYINQAIDIVKRGGVE